MHVRRTQSTSSLQVVIPMKEEGDGQIVSFGNSYIKCVYIKHLHKKGL